MIFKDAKEQKMIARFAYQIITTITEERDGIEQLKKIFLSSLLTPRDVLAQARKPQYRSGNVKSSIYEDIQYALYVEMCNNKNSRLFDSVYECATKLMKNYFSLNEYKLIVRAIRNGADKSYVVTQNLKNTILFFCLWYDDVPVGPLVRKSMMTQYGYLKSSKNVDSSDYEYGILDYYTLDIMSTSGEDEFRSIPIMESNAYKECWGKVIDKLIDYIKLRYGSDNVTKENLSSIIAKHVHTALDSDVKTQFIFQKQMNYLDETIFSAINWVGIQNYHFSEDLLHAIMGETAYGSYAKYVNHHPNVDTLIELAFQTYIQPYSLNNHGQITRIILRKEITPRIVNNIEAFYDRIVGLYYIDCLYKVVEQYRDEYYYNFPWFYDIEKQDALIEATITDKQSDDKKQKDDYTELNAQYERERKRVNEVCKKHAHELAEKDRAISAQTNEIEKLRAQLQIQQEFYSLASAAEELDITESLDISSLYGKRFLFVGKLYDSNAKLKQTFPTSTFMETDTANIKSLKVDGVVLLIRNMSHSMYYKVMQSNQFAELPKIYCNSRNINNIYQAMLNGAEK